MLWRVQGTNDEPQDEGLEEDSPNHKKERLPFLFTSLLAGQSKLIHDEGILWDSLHFVSLFFCIFFLKKYSCWQAFYCRRKGEASQVMSRKVAPLWLRGELKTGDSSKMHACFC